MDNRNSKKTMLAHIEFLELKVESLYENGIGGVNHVGAANYYDRICEAKADIQSIYDAETKNQLITINLEI